MTDPAQRENPTQKDWGSQIRKDIEELNMGTTMEDIKTMPKITLKKLVKTKVSEHAFKDLISKKKSKTKEVPHEKLIMQEYLEANDGVISIAEKKFLFQCRSRMLELKCNMKNSNLKDLKCSACGLEEESQMHLMQCEKLNRDNIEEAHEIKYSDLYSEDLLKIKLAGNYLKSKMKQMFDSYKIKRITTYQKQTKKIKQRKQVTRKIKPKIRKINK